MSEFLDELDARHNRSNPHTWGMVAYAHLYVDDSTSRNMQADWDRVYGNRFFMAKCLALFAAAPR